MSPNNSIIYISADESVDMADEWYEFASTDHFWIQWRFEAIVSNDILGKICNSQILEIGCGHGVVMKQFEQYFEAVVDGCDLNLFALKQINGVKGKIYLLNVFDRPKYLVKSYKAILLLDVLEHIDNDHQFLNVSCEYLREDGLVIINVPAVSWLYSKYDSAAGHKRRYSKRMVKTLFEKNGITNISIEYWGFFLIPVALIRKIVLFFTPMEKVIRTGFSTPNKSINKFFKILMKLEKLIFKRLWIGTSIVAVGKFDHVKSRK